MSESAKDLTGLKQIPHFSSIKEEDVSCVIDLENNCSGRNKKQLKGFSCCLIILFLLGFLCSQIVIFLDYSPGAEEVRESLQPSYCVNTKEKYELIDYAAVNNGGKVLRPQKGTLKPGKNSVEELISDNNAPGKCWGFEGNSATATIELFAAIFPQSFTIKHINSLDYSLAPKHFTVYSLQNNEKTLLGRYFFDAKIHEEKRTTEQLFPCKNNCDSLTRTIQLEINENYGNANTCVYQFKVHGHPL